MKIYLIGSLSNPRIPEVGQALRSLGHNVFDDWFSSGPDTDVFWYKYEQKRGRTFKEALNGFHAKHAFALDKYHLDMAEAAVLVLPAGRSAHLELGYMAGKGKPAYILLEKEPERFDIMYNFATDIVYSVDELMRRLSGNSK